jgi:hypothetical protein
VTERSFDRETYLRLVDIAIDRHDEAKVCADAGAHVAACVLVGAALEAVLLVTAANAEPDLRARDRWPSGDPLRWHLGRLLRLATEEGWFEPTDDLALAEAADGVRYVRNLVHPGAFVREMPADMSVYERLARGVYRVLEHVFDASWAVVELRYAEP